ncbi:alkaline phosphatase family protein [Vibrio splendidus]
MANLIVFIDALPFVHHELICKHITQIDNISKLTPEIGYSSNQHVALFSGKTPREIGYLTDYTLNKDALPGFSGRYIKHSNFSNYVVRKISSYITGNFSNIPLGMSDIFFNNGNYPLSSKEKLVSLNSGYEKFDVIVSDIDKDIEILDKLLAQDTMSKDVFLVLNSVDHNGHIYGVSDNRYINHLDELLPRVNEFIGKFKSFNNDDCNILLLSDHGMSDKPTKKRLVLEDEFGKQSPDKYIYFIDSSILKIWVFDSQLKKEISDYLNKMSYGRVLSVEDLDYYGIDEKFGDLIFVVHSDYYLEPQYFGFGLINKVNGMHGALPDSEYQFGIAISNRSIESSYRNLDIYNDVIIKNGFLDEEHNNI